MVSCRESLDTGETGVADRAAAAGDAGEGVADGVADEAYRRGCSGALGEEGRIAAWPWRYPGSLGALAMT